MSDEQSLKETQRIGRREERLELLRRFHQSRMTRKAFAEKHGVVLSTLDYWLTRERRNGLAGAGDVPMVFSEVKMRGQGLTEQVGWAMEVISPAGYTVRSREALAGGLLIRLLRVR